MVEANGKTCATADRDTKGPETYKVVLAYRGTDFAGFARQPGQKTIQGSLEEALRTILRREVDTVCAGRTDAGVHALGQVVSFPRDAGDPNPLRLVRSLNALVDEDIAIKSVEIVSGEFSARFDALSREYRYRIVAGSTPPIFLKDFAWWIRREEPLDLDAMSEEARVLLGEHDFASFCTTASAQGKSTTRFLETIAFEEEEHLGERCLAIRVVGNAFLHSMVRTIVGTIVDVGSGRRGLGHVEKVLKARSRMAAGENAPACGLTLWDVRYP